MELEFPKFGLFKGAPCNAQPRLTSSNMSNARLYDTLAGKARGGQRPGFDKWGNGDLIGGENQPIVAMCIVNTVE